MTAKNNMTHDAHEINVPSLLIFQHLENQPGASSCQDPVNTHESLPANKSGG